MFKVKGNKWRNNKSPGWYTSADRPGGGGEAVREVATNSTFKGLFMIVLLCVLLSVCERISLVIQKKEKNLPDSTRKSKCRPKSNKNTVPCERKKSYKIQ